jgi:soluble lytic murein transglycosylase-like protein
MKVLLLLASLLLPLATVQAQAQAYEPLEQLIRFTPNQLLELKLKRVLEHHKVQKPAYYAKLIAYSNLSLREKKLAAAIMVPESYGDAKATSSMGAQGAWQVMPFWKKKLNIKGSLYHPPTCLDAAMKVWNIHLNDARGNERKALVAYSGGSNGYPDKVFNILRHI